MHLNIPRGFLNHVTRKKRQINTTTLNTDVLVVPLFDRQRARLNPVKGLNNRKVQMAILQICYEERIVRRVVSDNRRVQIVIFTDLGTKPSHQGVESWAQTREARRS
jgi:hypothetical protein